MISAIAKAYAWQEKLESGEFSSIEELAKSKRVDRSYAGRILQLTSLAPSLVELVLSVTFARGLVLKTPVAKRAKANGARTPWTRAEDKKNDLLKKLKEAEQQQDFYSGLYRQYTTNLLKLVIYVRSLLASEPVREYLRERHPQQLEIFEQIINSTER